MSKNKFLLGFFIGMFTMAVAVGGIGVGLYFSQNTNNSASSSPATNYKLSYLEKVINAYYLEKTDKNNLEAGIYKGLISGLGDPYSAYYTADEYNEMKKDTAGKYYGIGVGVTQDRKTGYITVTKVYDNSFAEKAGMKDNDIIVKVENTAVTGMDIDKVITKIKGTKGSKVKIQVYRKSTKKYVELQVERGDVDIPTVSYKMLDKKNKIGYISISEFDKVTYNQFANAIKSLQKQSVKGIIFDLRNNPGGDYDIVSKMLDVLLPKGTIVYTIDKYGNKDEKISDDNCIKLPMVVLQNGNSASASEIFAGAMQDYKAATIVGTQSFGKGIVQAVFPLTDGSALKLTIEKYYTPNGKNIHGKGITPDVKVDDNTNTETDEQLNKGESVLKTSMGIKETTHKSKDTKKSNSKKSNSKKSDSKKSDTKKNQHKKK